MRGVLAFTQLAWGLRESKRLSCRGHFLGQAPTSSQKHRQAVTGSDKLPQALAGFDKLPQAPTSSDKLRLPQAPTSSDKLSKAPTNSHGLSDKLPQAPTNSHSLRQALTSSDQLPQVPASSHMLRQAQAPTSPDKLLPDDKLQGAHFHAPVLPSIGKTAYLGQKPGLYAPRIPLCQELPGLAGKAAFKREESSSNPL